MPKSLLLVLCLLATVYSSARAATPLELSMKKIAKAYHQLDKELKTPTDAGKPEYLSLVATMKTEAQSSRALVPKLVAALPADQQPAQIAEYQKEMDALCATFDVLGSDITAGNWTDATAQVAKLKQQETDGHKKFRKAEEKAPAATTPPPAPAPAQ
jgi:soluble cytochrome b562